MKKNLVLALLTTVGLLTQKASAFSERGQDDPKPAFRINLKYNADFTRYEVYALANFTQEDFLLGPSQISVVVPGQIADQSLDIYSATARWTDYSSTYAPSVAPDLDFHGVHSMGQRIDVQKDTPLMLFSFSLKGGYVDGVRLYLNGSDPNSMQKGMMGGDFANTFQNYKGHEFYRNGVTEADLVQITAGNDESGRPLLAVYPNPVTGEAVSVTVRQVEPGERLKLRLFSSSGVELSGVEETAEQLVNYRFRIPKQLAGQAYLCVERAATSTGPRSFGKKLIIQN